MSETNATRGAVDGTYYMVEFQLADGSWCRLSSLFSTHVTAEYYCKQSASLGATTPYRVVSITLAKVA